MDMLLSDVAISNLKAASPLYPIHLHIEVKLTMQCQISQERGDSEYDL